MSTRTVSVRLVGEVGSYVSSMNTAAAATMRVGDSAKSTSATAKSGFDIASKASLLMGAAVVGGLGMAVNASMNFERSMSAVQAATQASAGTLGDLRAAAMKAGKDTQYSATEAADAITEMGKAGVSAKDIMKGGLTGALNLAAAGQLDVADAAGIAATALQQFHLQGNQMSHVADLLAAGAGKAMGSVSDLAVALKYVGPVASSMGISIEETTGTLALFASQGILSDQAGTSLRGMLTALTSPSKIAAATMSDLGISVFDAQGKFIGMQGVAGQLHGAMKNLTEAERSEALGRIFGNEQITAARVLYQSGAEGVDKWTKSVNDSGYAAKQAHQLTDNLKGDIERLGGSLETLMISVGSGLQGPLRGLTQMLGGVVDGVTSAVGAFGALPGPVKLGVEVLGGLALLNGPLSGVLGTLKGFSGNLGASVKGTMGAFSEALGYARANGDGLGTVLRSVGSYAGEGFKGALSGVMGIFGGPWGLALAGGTAAVGFLSSAMHDSEQKTKDWAEALRSGGQAAANATAQLNAHVSAWDRLGFALDHGGSTIGLNAQRQREAEKANRDYFNSLDPIAQAQAKVSEWTSTLSYRTEKLGAGAEDTRTAQERLAYWTQILGVRQGEMTTATAGADSAIAGLGSTAGMTKDEIEAAAKAQEDWIKSVSQIETAFVDPLNTYKTLLADKQAAEQASAQATADSTASSSDSWKDYVKTATVSLNEYAAKLQEQITNQENWHANLVIVAQRAGYDVAAQLQQMGIDGAGLVAEFAHGTDAQLQNLGGLMRQDMANGTGEAASAFDQGLKVMAEIGHQGGAATANNVAAALSMGLDQVAAIAAQYGVKLADGINPVLASLGATRIVPGVGGKPASIVAGYGKFYDGGYTGDGPKFTPAGIVHKGEFVMPQEAVRRIGVGALGAMAGLPGYAGGGFVTAADVPRPYSTAPYGPPISTAGDGTMQAGYDATTAYLNATMGAMGGGPAGAGVQRWLPLVLASLNMVGQPGSLAQTVLRRMQQESGGNPRAINLTDSNARRGTPSKGLMQVIDPTFRAYAMPGHSSDIWDPLSNLLASERYAMARYGSLSAAYNKAGGYAGGGTTPVGDPFWVGEQGPELMWSNRQKYVTSAAQSREFSGGSGSSSGGSVNVPAPTVKVYLDGQEWRGMARVEAQGVVIDALTGATNRGRYNG